MLLTLEEKHLSGSSSSTEIVRFAHDLFNAVQIFPSDVEKKAIKKARKFHGKIRYIYPIVEIINSTTHVAYQMILNTDAQWFNFDDECSATHRR